MAKSLGASDTFLLLKKMKWQTFVELAKAGYGKTITQVRNIAGMAAHDKGKVESSVVSYGWLRRFLERHLHLSYHKGDPTANVRMNCLNK